METLAEVIDKFRSRQYIYDFYVHNNLLKCKETNERFKTDEVIIDKTERYEGDSNPDDMSIIYAISTNTDTKGILIDAFGVYANSGISEFVKNIRVKKKAKNQTKHENVKIHSK